MVEALVVERYPTDRATAALTPPEILDVVGGESEIDAAAQRPPARSSMNFLERPVQAFVFEH
jgi:hypothetical protein